MFQEAVNACEARNVVSGRRAISAQVLSQIGMVSTNAWTTLNFPTHDALADSPLQYSLPIVIFFPRSPPIISKHSAVSPRQLR